MSKFWDVLKLLGMIAVLIAVASFGIWYEWKKFVFFINN